MEGEIQDRLELRRSPAYLRPPEPLLVVATLLFLLLSACVDPVGEYDNPFDPEAPHSPFSAEVVATSANGDILFAESDTVTVNCAWSGVENATRFEVQWSGTPDFGDADSVTVTGTAASFDFSNDRTIYWRVRFEAEVTSPAGGEPTTGWSEWHGPWQVTLTSDPDDAADDGDSDGDDDTGDTDDDTGDGVQAIPEATITVDGSAEDWAGIEPFVEDAVGDTQTGVPAVDLIQAYVAQDGEFLYWRMDVSGEYDNSELTEYVLRLYPRDAERGAEGHIELEVTMQDGRVNPGLTVWTARDERVPVDVPTEYSAADQTLEMRIELAYFAGYSYDLVEVYTFRDDGDTSFQWEWEDVARQETDFTYTGDGTWPERNDAADDGDSDGDDDTGDGVQAIPEATITVDGSAEDWAGIEPFFVDESGDAAAGGPNVDITDVYIAKDDEWLYFRMEVADFVYDESGDTVYGLIAVKESGWDPPEGNLELSGSILEGEVRPGFYRTHGDEGASEPWDAIAIPDSYGAIGTTLEMKVELFRFHEYLYTSLWPFTYREQEEDRVEDKQISLTYTGTVPDESSGEESTGGTVDPPGEFVTVAGGSFTMGSADITVSTFEMGRYEVTQAQYEAVMGTNPSHFSEGTEAADRPVDSVSWYEAVVYANRLSIAEGRSPVYSIAGSTNPDEWAADPTGGDPDWGSLSMDMGADGYRLPTEAEWEYAARGGEPVEGFTHAGSDTFDEVGWYVGNSGGTPHPGGGKSPNRLGLYDMSGNVWEWVWDRYGDAPTGTLTDPKGPTSGSARGLRGAGWNDDYSIYFRNNADAGLKSFEHGFRLVYRAP